MLLRIEFVDSTSARLPNRFRISSFSFLRRKLMGCREPQISAIHSEVRAMAFTKEDFLPNKYTRWYFSIIEHRKISPPSVDEFEKPEKFYIERHHIIPNSFGGSNEEDV